MSEYKCSAESQVKIDEFEAADAVLKEALQNFEERMATELDQLDRLREDRNEKLVAAKLVLRAEAEALDITQVKSFRAGRFSVQKKQSFFYATEKLVAMLKEKNLYDQALDEKVVIQQMAAAKFEEVQNFLKKAGVQKEFECCEDGVEITPAITCPKPIAGFGTEIK